MAQAGAPGGEARGGKVAAYEWVRALGCVAIVALHVFVSMGNAVGYGALGQARLVVEGSLSIALTRWAVPCFLMVSGALLLDEGRNLGWPDVWRYERRMLFVLGTFGLAFCLVESAYVHRSLGPAVVAEAVLNLVTARSWGHLWYVYALLGLYALTPALRWLVFRLGAREATVVLVALYALALVPPTVVAVREGAFLSPLNLVPSLFYFYLGWYARSFVALDLRLVCAGLLSLAAMVACQAAGMGQLALPEYCLVAPYGLLVFKLFCAFAKDPVEGHPPIAALADRSFGIYVLHPVFLHVIVRIVNPLLLPVGVFEALAFALSLACSYVAVGLVRRVPSFAGRI